MHYSDSGLFETRLKKLRRSVTCEVRVSSVSGAVALRLMQTYTGLVVGNRGLVGLIPWRNRLNFGNTKS